MASKNWCVLDKDTLKPVPLPREKILLELSSVSLHLFPTRTATSSSSSGSTTKPIEYKAERGTAYLSNQRVIYVAPPQLLPGDSSSSSLPPPSLETLSVPYSHFQDGRFNQPFFGANYFEALCLPASDGGLNVSDCFPLFLLSRIASAESMEQLNVTQAPHTLRLYFKEGGGFDFYSTVLEMKERLASLPRSSAGGRRSRTSSSNNVVAEDLRMSSFSVYYHYRLPILIPFSSLSLSALYTATPTTPSSAPDPVSRPSPSSSSAPRTMPSNSDLQAAAIAREAESNEDEARSRPAVPAPPPPPTPTFASSSTTSTSNPPPIGNDAPPSYSA